DVPARPLSVLVPLIQDDLKQAREAAERASLPYYRAAGEKLIEAKSQIGHGEFQLWVKGRFGISQETATRYMRLAEYAEKSGTPEFSSLSDFIRQTSNPNYNRRLSARRGPSQKTVDRMVAETNLMYEAMKRKDEREAQRTLALQVIDTGYKALARSLHPDK